MSRCAYPILTTILCLALAGCAASQSNNTQEHTSMVSNATHPTIELLYFDGCPNTPPFRESLEAAIEESGDSFIPVDLTQLDDSDIRRGYGSPTILVDGQDLFDMPVPKSPTMSCRIYAGGLPDTNTLIAKLSERTK